MIDNSKRTRCEVWKDIKGYDGKYQISNLGRLKRLEYKDNIGRNRKEIIIKFFEFFKEKIEIVAIN